jgi:lysine-specific demethylase 8
VLLLSDMQDPYYNCYAQVVGRKRVWLAPPKCEPYMACHVKGSSDLSGEEESTLASEYMNNTSTIPVLRPDITRDDLTKSNPLFMEHVWPHCMEAVLEPGDLMVMPPGWWHAMRGEGPGPGWSVSMWY